MLPEVLDVEAESSRKQHFMGAGDFCESSLPVLDGSRKVREKESQKL